LHHLPVVSVVGDTRIVPQAQGQLYEELLRVAEKTDLK